MRTTPLFIVTIMSLLICSLAFSEVNTTANDISYIGKKTKQNQVLQQDMRNTLPWQNFMNRNGVWYVTYNEDNKKPHRAFGNPISLGISGSDEEKARYFIREYLSDFDVDESNFILSSVKHSKKHIIVRFKQQFNGLVIENSDAIIKMTLDSRVVMFGLDVYDNITLNSNPHISLEEVQLHAKKDLGVGRVLTTEVDPSLRILAIANPEDYNFHLIYEVYVKTVNERMPEVYRTYVDANNGDILFRQNEVRTVRPHPSPPPVIDATFNGTVYPTHIYNPSAVRGLENLRVRIGVNNNYTGTNGLLNLSNGSPVSATIFLDGLWSDVETSGVTPSFTTTLNTGSSTISFDSNANIKELSAYYHVNEIHEYMKSLIPSFTDMDFPLPTNVDLTGDFCNAFYSGGTINFWVQGSGCNSLAQVGDVIYHEYGHAIQDGFNISNGALGEGYADVWALSLTENPILGIGFDDTDPTISIRRYDQDPKIYPVDLIGEVHADGEIIAGAFWDLGIGLNSIPQMMSLFTDILYVGSDGPNGNEGNIFVDVLIDVLQADDNDGNILNGTPNDLVIIDAFAKHGITLTSNSVINHTEVLAAAASNPINVTAVISPISYPWAFSEARIYYRSTDVQAWSVLAMNNVGGSNYSATLPAQNEGIVIEYFLATQDIYNNIASVTPAGAFDDPANIPYFILVGFSLKETDDFDFSVIGNGAWVTGAGTDNATTGVWLIDIPTPSYWDYPNTASYSLVQTDLQHTFPGDLCAITGNAPLISDPVGTNDVDGGVTTLRSPAMNLSTYTNPVVTYYRWYINNPPTGANPGNDYWDVQVSGNGVNWVEVERTNVSDKSWRRYAFRVRDYITPTASTYVRFQASDSLIPGAYLEGGSLVEAAVDDVQLWDGLFAVSTDANRINGIDVSVYPNPADEVINLAVSGIANELVRFQLVNSLGEIVREDVCFTNASGLCHAEVDVESLPAGIYHGLIKSSGIVSKQKIAITR